MKLIHRMTGFNEQSFAPTMKLFIEVELNLELIQDLKCAFPLDAEAELSKLLSEQFTNMLKELTHGR